MTNTERSLQGHQVTVSPAAAALALSGVTVRYGEVVANRDVDLTVLPGEIHALVGENGAGKSTLMKAVVGLVPLDAGTVTIGGVPLPRPSPRAALACGVAMVHQHFLLVDPLSVVDNVILGCEPRRPGLLGRLGVIDRSRALREVSALGHESGLLAAPGEASIQYLQQPVAALSVGQRQRVEILKVLYQQAQQAATHRSRILILDEPTAVLTPRETAELFAVLVRWAQGGGAVVLVTHKLDEVMAISSVVTVLRRGQVQATLRTAVTSSQALARAMVGRDLVAEVPALPRPGGKVRLAVHALTTIQAPNQPGSPAHDVSLTLRAGEILGIAGVEGNGQTALVESLLGLRRLARGAIELDGRDITRSTPAERRRRGLGFVPEDRQRRGLLLDRSVADNLLLGREATYRRRFGVLDRRRLEHDTRSLIERYDVRPADLHTPVRALSGGNQQKLILARELACEPKVLIAAQPTRGVDLAAVAQIHSELAALRAADAAVLLVSSELDELLALADRILVMLRGRVVATLERAAATRDLLGQLMTGASLAA